MRFVIVIVFLLNLGSCFSQIRMALSLPEYNIVYRGYNNILAVSTRTKMNPEFLELNCDGALLQVRENNEWTLNPFTTADSLEIRIIHSKTKEIIDRFVYRVRNMPDPELYVGPAESGGQISAAETRLFARYSDSPLKAEFMILGGEAFVGNNSYAFPITNNRFGSDYLQYVKNQPVGTKIYIKVLVRGVDKIERIIYGEYVL